MQCARVGAQVNPAPICDDHEPGNGTRYVLLLTFLADGSAVLSLVNFGRCARLSGVPGEAGYLAEKLGIGRVDAEAVYKWLDSNWRAEVV